MAGNATTGKRVALIIALVVLLYLGSYFALRPFAVAGEWKVGGAEFYTFTNYVTIDGMPVEKQDLIRPAANRVYAPLLMLDRRWIDSRVNFSGKRTHFGPRPPFNFKMGAQF